MLRLFDERLETLFTHSMPSQSAERLNLYLEDVSSFMNHFSSSGKGPRASDD